MKKEIIPMPVFLAGMGASFLVLFALFCFSPLRGWEMPWEEDSPEAEKTAYYMTDRIYQVIYPIDVNHATKEELMGIPGVGEETAQKILDYRQRKGEIFRMEELLAVEGIGEKTLSQLEEYLCC